MKSQVNSKIYNVTLGLILLATIIILTAIITFNLVIIIGSLTEKVQ